MKKISTTLGRKMIAAGAAGLGIVRDLLIPTQPAAEFNDRQLYDTDIIGEYNHRTGRLDAGNDPYGWYEED